MMMANMSIVMQLVRCATGGLNREAVMQSGKDRDAGHTMVEARRKRMAGKRKRKSQIISRRQAKAVCGRRAKRVWKREDVRRAIVAEAGSDEEEIISSPESNVVRRGRHVRRRVWKRGAVRRAVDAVAGSDEEEMLTRKEEEDVDEDEVDEDDVSSSAPVVKPLAMTETANVIREWRRRHENAAVMQRYIEDVLSQEKNSQLVRSQQRAIPVLAQLALLKDNPDMLVKQHGRLYRWVWQYEKATKQEGELCHLSEYIKLVKESAGRERHHALPAGWRWMLQLNVRREKDTEDCWWDWVFIKKSNIAGGNLGVFAARCFPKGSIVGYFAGPIVWKCDAAGTEEPSEEYLTAQGVPDSAYSICILNGECVWNSINPKPVGQKPGEAMYLGMHYINNVCLCFKSGSPEYETAKKYQNCVLVDEGSVKAFKKICPGGELFTAYSKDENVVRKKGGGRGMDSAVKNDTDRKNSNSTKLEM